MAVLIDGKVISTKIKEELKQEVTEMKAQGITPCLAVILVGDDSASAIYVRNKKRACEYVGIESRSYELPEDTTQEELEKLVTSLNEDENVDGILVQLPLPGQIDEEKITTMISPKKDVDGFLADSIGALCLGTEGFRSCTPAGVIELIRRSGYSIEGKECVVVGRSTHVGKPMALLLLQENGTVTIAHSRTKNLGEITRRADILVAAVGKAKIIKACDVKEGAIVIDVGMNRDENGKLCGDVDFEQVKEKAEAITPVPGGVGPMTIAMLMNNCVEAARKKRRE